MKKLLTLFALSLLSACVVFLRDYEVMENSENSSFAPSWIIQSKAHRAEKPSDTTKYRYFVGSADNTHLRLCLKTSELNAIKKISSETSSEIVKKANKQNKTKKNSDIPNLKDDMEKNILVNLQGISIVGEYWEKRHYLKEKGAKEEYYSYKCDTVVKIKKSALINAIETYLEKIQNTLKDKNKKIIKEAASSYLIDLKAGQ